MESEMYDQKQSSFEVVKQNNNFDFTSYYKSAAETRKAIEKAPVETEIENRKGQNGSPSKTRRTKKKNKSKLEPLEISHIDIEDPTTGTLVARSTPLNESKTTSTPRGSTKGDLNKVKSIMKNKSLTNSDDYLNGSIYSPSSKPKKRNKSVSFMLEDNEEVVVKKTKSNESIRNKPESAKKSAKEVIKVNKVKSPKKDVIGKENKKNDNVNTELDSMRKTKKAEKSIVKDKVETISVPNKDSSANKEVKANKKRNRLLKKQESVEATTESNNNENQTDNKNRKPRKKKHSAKMLPNSDTTAAEGEPAAKTQKKEDKPEAIAEDLESLSIGDNAHTLTNLLDEMTVVDKDKKKRNKLKKAKKDKKTTLTAPAPSSSESADLEKIEEGKEKVIWKKRKWNKDKKGELVEEDVTSTSIIVDNLPLTMVCDYKKLLADHFGKHGLIKKIGVAEVYPTEESKPIFSTTIQFYSDGAATEALAEDDCEVGGAPVRVRRALPPTQTTLVVRSYGQLTDQNVSSAFAAAGRIRTIRHLVKGKKTICTAFVEFDGPEALSRALALGAEARAGGKRVHAARYDAARRRRPEPAGTHSEQEDN